MGVLDRLGDKAVVKTGGYYAKVIEGMLSKRRKENE